MGTFRVLITGGRQFSDYKLLRTTLDKLLANRMPDVELLTSGGPGAPVTAELRNEVRQWQKVPHRHLPI